MKKFFVFLIIMLVFTTICIYATEKTDVLSLQEQTTEASFYEKDGQSYLEWKRMPYPCFYKVEVFYPTSGKLPEEADYHKAVEEYTLSSTYKLPGTAIPTSYRITAYGIFGAVNGPSEYIENPTFSAPLRPVPIFKYDSQAPASVMPFLVWHTIPGGVLYELEILSGPPDKEFGTALSKKNHLYSTQQVFTNGYQIDLKPFLKHKNLYWRVRALNLQKQPVGEFCEAQPLVIDESLPVPNKPMLNTFDQMPNFKQPLYPVYSWIPINGTMNYEVELMTTPPPEENNTAPAPNRVWQRSVINSFNCYDEYPRPYAGDYYWRVRGIDANGNTIGTYSDTAHFVVTSNADGIKAAAFGDSITHGGGNISFSPANLEYSYTTYLDFDCVNLGRSGDTSHATMLRFDQDVLPYKPKNLLILTGSNSLRNPLTSAQDIIGDLQEIQTHCLRNNIRPIFLTLMPINPQAIMKAFKTPTDPNWHKKMTLVNQFIRSQNYYIDLEPYFYDEKKQILSPDFSTDGLHPDIIGKMLMAEIINIHKDLLK